MKNLLAILLLLSVPIVNASVPEPPFVIQGHVFSAGEQVTQNGMLITARYADVNLAESTLSSSNNYQFTLEIPLEANIGSRDIYHARVGDVLSLQIAGTTVANVQISDRGILVIQNVQLPSNFDSDGDGIYDSLELADGKNPNDPNDPVLFGNLDIDNDGISNGLEFLSNTYNPRGDYDGDGFANEDEYTLGSAPNNAAQFPKTAADIGKASIVDAGPGAYRNLLDEHGAPLVWDEVVNGVPSSMLFAYWNIDLRLDLVIATDHGKVFVLEQNAQNQYASPQLISLFSLPVGGPIQLGFTNFDSEYGPELWAFSAVNQILYIYKRSADGQPFGSSVWRELSLPQITGRIAFGDINGDDAQDIVASGVDIGDPSTVISNVMASFAGAWDGYAPSFSAPTLLFEKPYNDNGQLYIIPNIKETGFDKLPDLIFRGNGKQSFIITSHNGLDDPDRIRIFKTVESDYTESSQLGIFGGQMSESYSDVFAYADIMENEYSGYSDYIFYTANSPGAVNNFRVLLGLNSTLDTDGDGIPDFKDLDANDPNIPLPNGNVDYDGDGIPYAVDGNNSGLEDADNDGMSDLFEIKNGLNPLDASDANLDPDNDGRTNLEESLDGTNPRAKTSVLTQDATLVASIATFETGAAKMLLVDEELAVASTNNASVKLYDLNNLSQARSIESSDANGVAQLATSGKYLIMGNVGGTIEVWDVNSSIKLATFNKNTSTVTDLSIDGVNLYALHADGYFYQFNLQTLSYIGNWKIYDGFLTSLLARNNILYIQASNPEKIMFVWDATKQEVIYNINGGAECCEKVVAELSGENLILANSYSGSGIYATNIGNLNSQEVVPNLDVSAVKAVNNSIYVGRTSGVIESYSSVDGSFQARVAAPYSQVRGLELINGGFISLHADGQVYIWEHK
ncbi:hypothetical protein NBRC116188_21640 [Oceaniserpentilla sp. 4NH20-0058]|uniref:eIF2A-related protein n=1 Tax=Oceaniserpentilla sp. 4NH20-0058 TaxID=3127660 RepID=UPI0031035C51